MRTAALLSTLAGMAALVLAFTPPAQSASGKVESPSVAFSVAYPKVAQAQVIRALSRPDCKFLDGQWLNSFTSLRYGGDTPALNQMLDDLVKCPGVTVHVSLRRLPDEANWRVGHNAHDNRFQVEVNLDGKGIKVEDLYIPEATGPALKP